MKIIQLPPSNYLIIYHTIKTLDEATWLLRLEKLNKRQMFGKNLKKCKFCLKISQIRKVKLLKINPLKLTTIY